MDNTPDSPAKTPDGCTPRGGNYWTLFTPEIWKVFHAVSQPTEADTLSRLVEAHRRSLETQELERRVAALEEKHGPTA
jgi:hypothetical protein